VIQNHFSDLLTSQKLMMTFSADSEHMGQCRIKTLEALVHSEKNEAPKIQLGGLESPVSSPSGVWGGSPAEIEFGVL